MTDDATKQNFRALRERYFDELCQKLGLNAGEADVGHGFATVAADFGTVRVHFEYERGLCSFAIGTVSDSRPLCSVEDMAQRFPRLRSLSEGLQRLSLDEQCAFLESRWADLQVMFSPEHLPETRKWRAAALAAYMNKFTGKS